MAKITLFHLLGVNNASDAANLWPRTRIQFATGHLVSGAEPEDYEGLMNYLNNALTFHAVRPGASFDRLDLDARDVLFDSENHRVGITAEFEISHLGIPPADIFPLVLAQMNTIAFYLLDTDGSPARIFITQSEQGTDIVIESLPVEIQVPSDILSELKKLAPAPPP